MVPIYSEVFSNTNNLESSMISEPTNQGDKKIPIRDSIELWSNSITKLLFQVVFPSNRSGFIIHEIRKPKDKKVSVLISFLILFQTGCSCVKDYKLMPNMYLARSKINSDLRISAPKELNTF